MKRQSLPDNQLVRQAAEELTRAIQLTPEWRELEAARTAFQTDPELAEFTARYRKLSEQWQRARSEGRALPGKEALELASVQEKIQQHDIYLRLQAAVGAFVALLQETNQVISQPLGLDFASNAAPRSSCCG